jgi:GDP/UDP-N,N'-diacetylbacillosamine 2-epimerase (hydrolysing)
MRTADCLVGNSSTGILEAGFFHLPVVNVGNRQKGREHGKNVRFVPHEKNKIIAAVKKACFDKRYLAAVKSMPHLYGDGHSVRRIVNMLANIPLTDKLVIKILDNVANGTRTRH